MGPEYALRAPRHFFLAAFRAVQLNLIIHSAYASAHRQMLNRDCAQWIIAISCCRILCYRSLLNIGPRLSRLPSAVCPVLSLAALGFVCQLTDSSFFSSFDCRLSHYIHCRNVINLTALASEK